MTARELVNKLRKDFVSFVHGAQQWPSKEISIQDITQLTKLALTKIFEELPALSSFTIEGGYLSLVNEEYIAFNPEEKKSWLIEHNLKQEDLILLLDVSTVLKFAGDSDKLLQVYKREDYLK